MQLIGITINTSDIHKETVKSKINIFDRQVKFRED